MFEIGHKVFSKNSGVCVIVSKELKNFGIGEQVYFVLEPFFNKKNDTSKLYVPEQKANEQLRGLLDKEKVLKLVDMMKSCERIWYSDPKIRKQKFQEIYTSGDLEKICQLIKSLHMQNEEMKQVKKTLSMIDREFLDKMEKDIHEEFSLALDIEVNMVPEFLASQIEGN